MDSATHFIEQWKDKQGQMHFTKPKPINEFNRALANSRYGFKTIVTWKIRLKPGIQIEAFITNTQNQ